MLLPMSHQLEGTKKQIDTSKIFEEEWLQDSLFPEVALYPKYIFFSGHLEQFLSCCLLYVLFSESFYDRLSKANSFVLIS